MLLYGMNEYKLSSISLLFFCLGIQKDASARAVPQNANLTQTIPVVVEKNGSG